MTYDLTALFPAILTAVVTGVVTAVSIYGGVTRSLAELRTELTLLAKQVEKHNNIVERMYKVESELATCWRRHDDLRERVERLEELKIGGSE